MIAMKFTSELDIGLSFLQQAGRPRLVADRETKLVVLGGPSDRTAVANAALRSRKRKLMRKRLASLRMPLQIGGSEFEGPRWPTETRGTPKPGIDRTTDRRRAVFWRL